MKRIAIVVVTGIALTLAAASCVGNHGQSTLDAISGSIQDKTPKPIVEAYVEYPGPQERWSGPSTLAVHITARDGADPSVSVSPNIFQLDGAIPTPPKRSALTTQIVRERLALVATALSVNTGKMDEPGGCLYPMRARLIRSDGSLIEKRGCRSPIGWAFQASDAATDLVAAAETPAREPASAPVPAAVQAVKPTTAPVPAAVAVPPTAPTAPSNGGSSPFGSPAKK
jgi:hypothetical protein